ncbi:uncharacterized protein [Procambarus clarkii]|uniref:uncharacterized protein n=1 Tax=Procambarus clarkii TaxID=6728 RepID=UPI003744A700
MKRKSWCDEVAISVTIGEYCGHLCYHWDCRPGRSSLSQVVIVLVLGVARVVLGSPTPQPLHEAPVTEWPIIPYEFGYEVADPETNNFQNRAEMKTTNGDVFGSYSLLLPTNEILTLSYNVTGDLGFQYSLVLSPVPPAAA